MLKAEIVNVTPSIARSLRDTAHFERQRKITDARVQALAHEMKMGWFIEGTPIFICVLPNKAMLIVNGNHTLEAISYSGVTLPLTIIYRDVDSVDHAAAIYANLDIQKTRSWNDALKAIEGEAANAFDNKVLAASGDILNNFGLVGGHNRSSSRTQRFAMLEQYSQVGMRINAMIKDTPTKHRQVISRASILAVALVTCKSQPTVAEEFWGGMAADDGLKANDPRKTLLRWLLSNEVHGKRHVQASAAALAWNAFYESRELRLLKPGAMGDFFLLGTPWHKGKPEEAVGKYKPLHAPVEDQSSLEMGEVTTAKGRKQTVRLTAKKTTARPTVSR